MATDLENTNSLISVIIPVYNVEKYIERCLDSVINQTYKNIEIICIDDGSIDKTQQILAEYSKKDKRIKIINQKHFGASITRNIGIENAKGNYIIFIDSDDFWEPDCVESAYNKIKENNADIVIFAYNEIYKNSIKKNYKNFEILSHYENKAILPEDLIQLCGVVWDKMYKKEFLLRNNIRFAPQLKIGEDLVFNHICICNSPKYAFLPKFLYNYTKIRKKSIMNHSNQVVKMHIVSFKYFMQTPEYINSNSQLQLLFIDKYLSILLYYIKAKRYRCSHILYNYQISKFYKEIKQLINNNLLCSSKYYKTINNFSFQKYMLRNLFSITNKKTYYDDFKLIKILGFRISIRMNKDFDIYKKFKNNIIKNKTVLIIEANSCHGETLGGYIKYFHYLGYNVDILCSKEIAKENPFDVLPKNYYQNIYAVKLNTMSKILASDKIEQYDYIFFNSYHLYYKQHSKFTFVPITKIFTKITEPKKSIIALEHHLDNLNQKLCRNKQILKLVKIENDAIFCNSHFYGETNISSKNDITQFIIIGNLNSSRKNSNMLINAMNELISKNITNFRINIVGDNNIPTSKDLAKHIKYYGRTSYSKMYEHIKESDFILALLDPENGEHERYIKYGTTGSVQLSYGFIKPFVVHNKFASVYELDENNAVVYNHNLEEAMEKCIKMSKEEYQKICENLYETHTRIEKESIDNLENVLNVKS